MLNEKEASQLSDSEFKELVMRKLNELTQNYQNLQGNYNELTANYINMKQEIETINKGQEEMKNTISELMNTVQGMKTTSMKQRIGSASWRTKQKKHPERARKGKEAQKEGRGIKGNAGQHETQ